MPRTKLQNIVFTIIMAVIMVYGMIVYNWPSTPAASPTRPS